jgi:transglutaminase-like putative cysteine protease
VISETIVRKRDVEKYLRATSTIDSDSREIREKAACLTIDKITLRSKSVPLFYFVRDQIQYKIRIFQDAESEDFRASLTLRRRYGFCTTKAVLMVALCRAVGIPARLCLCDIRHHRLPPALVDLIGTNVLFFHGYCELFLDDGWIKVDPAFDIEFCRSTEVPPVDFSGYNNALLSPADIKGRSYIEYLSERGCFEDVPVQMIVSGLKKIHGPLDREKMAVWNRDFY